jgi:hypothetical protein
MAKKEPTNQPLAPQTAAALAERLIQHADNIRNPAAAATMGADMRAAAALIESWRTEENATRILSTETEGLVHRAIATANARREGTIPPAGTHGALTMEILIVLLLEDVAWTQSRPGSWEGAGMSNVLFAHGYDVEPRR